MVVRRPPKGPSSRPPPADPETLPRVNVDSAPLPRFHTDESAPVPDVEKILLERAAAPLPSFNLDPVTEEPFDAAPTKLRETKNRDEFSEVAPTKLRSNPTPFPGGASLNDDASLDDVVEELREATGHKPKASELSTSALVDAEASIEPANSTMEVEVSDLMIDRPVPQRDLWNVRQAQPRGPMRTVRVERPPPRRSAAPIIIGLFIGAALVFGVLAFLYLRSLNAVGR